MKIIMDMDEVIVDFLNPLLRKHSEKMGFTGYLTRHDITEYNLDPTMIEIFKEPGFFAGLPALPGAIDGMRSLRLSGHDVIIASVPSGLPHVAAEKMQWVSDQLPEFFHDMHIVERKDRLIGDIIVDDSPFHLLKSPCEHKIVMSRRYNLHQKDMFRVCDWSGLLLVVDYLSINPYYRSTSGARPPWNWVKGATRA